MAPEKVTEMVLNVDLKCSGCYKKVKKIICKIPEIRDQHFDVEKNKVKIMVVCCSPEKIRDKLCYKGNGAIQSIEIIEKKEPEKTEAYGGKPKKAKEKKPVETKANDTGNGAIQSIEIIEKKEPEKTELYGWKPEAYGGKPKKAKEKKPIETKANDTTKDPEQPKTADTSKMVYEPVHGYTQMYPPSGYPMIGYRQYYDQGYGGPQYQHGYGMPLLTPPPPPPPSYGGFGAYEQGYNGYNGYNDNRSHHSSNHYGGEEDGEGCSIM